MLNFYFFTFVSILSKMFFYSLVKYYALLEPYPSKLASLFHMRGARECICEMYLTMSAKSQCLYLTMSDVIHKVLRNQCGRQLRTVFRIIFKITANGILHYSREFVRYNLKAASFGYNCFRSDFQIFVFFWKCCDFSCNFSEKRLYIVKNSSAYNFID